jgi:phytoene dehydrogenase-like protein
MKNEVFDGIIIGAGHNGLISAAYLAKAGLKVAVFENRPNVGGAFTTEELSAPGFRHNIHAVYLKIHDSPVHTDLDLERYGVSYIFPRVKQSFIKHDSYFIFYQNVEATYESLKRVSRKDAETFRRVARQWRQWYVDFLLPEMYSAPKPPDQWEEDILKKPGGRQYRDVVLNYSPVEYAAELFESEYGRATVTRGAISAEYDPTSKGIPTLVFATIVNWFAGNTGIVRGGTRLLPEALARIVRENGGQVFPGQPVGRIIVDGGVAKGIMLKDGREVRAERFVLSSLDPVNTFLFMVGEDKLGDEVLERLAAYKFNETSLFRVHLALKERPIFEISRQEPAVNDALMYTVGYDNPGDLVTLVKQARSGRIPDVLGLTAENITAHDPSQAPAGGHTAYLGLAVPFDLADGGGARWVDMAHETAEKLLAKFRQYAPNITNDKIVARFNYSPKDIEEYLPDLVSGDICQGKICPEQLGFNRPWPGMSRYRTPIEKLYLGGACTHPGGHAHGGPGYNAANAIAEDLGIIKWWPSYDPLRILKAQHELSWVS